MCDLAAQHPSVIFSLGSGEDCLCPGPTPPLVNTPCGGGVLVFSAKKTHFLFSCPSVRAVSISQSPPSTRGKAGCLHSRSPCVLHTQTTQRQSGQPEGQRRGSSCPDGLWKLHLNSSRQVLFLLSDLVYTSFGLGSFFFFFLKQLKLVFAYITPPHDYILTFLVTSSAVFLLWEFCLFRSYSPWYRKAMKSPLKPTYLFPQSTRYPVYLKREMPKMWVSSLQSLPSSTLSGPQIFGTFSALSTDCLGHAGPVE